MRAVASMEIGKPSITIVKGKTSKIMVTIKPSNASNKKLRWMSSNKSIATVSSSWIIKGIKRE